MQKHDRGDPRFCAASNSDTHFADFRFSRSPQRIILRQFQCTCDGAGDINISTGDTSICYATINSASRCFPADYNSTQIAAFICGFLYLVGIPIFYYQLITRTVNLVLSTSRQYKLLTLEINRLESLEKEKRTEVAEDLKEYKKIQFKLYCQ